MYLSVKIQRIHAEVELVLQVQIFKVLCIISCQNEHIMMGIRCISVLNDNRSDY